MQAALQMHEVLEDHRLARQRARRVQRPALAAPAGGLARGEVVEMGGDCFGDAVNVAARLLDHAGDNETLITAEVLPGCRRRNAALFRSLDQMVLRGRVEPVQVHVHGRAARRRQRGHAVRRRGPPRPSPTACAWSGWT
jgi:adenylate cyclase